MIVIGGFVAGDFEHIAHGAPAGGMSSTAADMARWMQLHLRLGEIGGVRILRSDSAQRMRGVLHSNAPGAAAVEHGWLTQRFGDLEAFGHAGATLMFHSQMVLLPELDLGIFVSTNTATGRESMRDLVRLIIEFEAPATALQPAPAFDPGAAALARLEGHYLGNRRPYRSAEKLLLGLGAVTRVQAVEQGLLLRRGNDVRKLLPEAPLQFRVSDSDERVVFLQQPDGSIAGFVDGHGRLLPHHALPCHQVKFRAQLFGARIFDPNVYFISSLPSVWKLSDTLIVAGTALLMSVCATLYPAYRASRIAPAEALRYE